MISQALKEEPNYDEDETIEAALRGWLGGERDTAKLVQLARPLLR